MPFDGGAFLQPYVAPYTPEELVPLNGVEDLVITVIRDIYRCEMEQTKAQHIFWIQDSNVDTATIVVFRNDVAIDAGDIQLVNHGWDDAEPGDPYGWDPCCGCEGPPWDTDQGVKVNITLDVGDIIEVKVMVNKWCKKL